MTERPSIITTAAADEPLPSEHFSASEVKDRSREGRTPPEQRSKAMSALKKQ